MRLIAFLTLAAMAQCQPDETLTGHGAAGRTWILQERGDDPVDLRTELRFSRRGVMEGRGPCNPFRARVSVPYPWFALEEFESGQQACPDRDAEEEVIVALKSVTLVEIAGDTMLLTNDDATLLLRFKAE